VELQKLHKGICFCQLGAFIAMNLDGQTLNNAHALAALLYQPIDEKQTKRLKSAASNAFLIKVRFSSRTFHVLSIDAEFFGIGNFKLIKHLYALTILTAPSSSQLHHSNHFQLRLQ